MRPLRIHGLPLHPLLVHFPVAAWTAATGLALAAPLELAAGIPRLAAHVNAVGILTGALAMLAGLLELAGLPPRPALRDAVARHMLLACSAWLAFVVMWVLQVRALEVAAAGAGAVGLALLVAAGHAGARVVYHHGFPPRPEAR